MQLSKALDLIQSKHHCQLCSISFVNGDSTRVNYTTVHGDMFENVLLEEDQIRYNQGFEVREYPERFVETKRKTIMKRYSNFSRQAELKNFTNFLFVYRRLRYNKTN